ncbi:microtubule-associated protein RP/EB family member 1C-like [Bidens hawaiensis]|uniref:microtubule-associated protein RP/EB family member 1C-like n=1 Tax=Bidens hawaiensis TaxID=980011 RepID=UPI00404A4F2F
MATNIGIMDAAYFVGRSELLAWIKHTLHLTLNKVEEACTGAVHCQLMDAAHPGMVPMHKVNFDARTEYEMIQNFKILQDVFTKLNITKHIEVSRLVKGRPLDNLEFMQWMKRYCDSVSGDYQNYNPEERREASKGGKDITKKSAQSQPTRGTTAALKTHNTRKADAPSVKNTKPSSTAGTSAYDQQVADLKSASESLEKERDFYFTKLRDVEMICQLPTVSNLLVVEVIKKVLYAAEEDTSVMEEAKATLLMSETDVGAGQTVEVDLSNPDSQKRKTVVDAEVDDAANTRLRVSDASDVHSKGSPLMTL